VIAQYVKDASVTGLSNGGFVVTWDSNGQDSDDWGVYGQRYDADGTALRRGYARRR